MRGIVYVRRNGRGLAIKGLVITAGFQGNRQGIRCLKMHRDTLSFAPVFGFKNAKMKMRTAGEARVSRMCDDFPGLDPLSWRDHATAFLQMTVVRQRGVVMTN